MICDMGAGVQRDRHTGGGALVQGTVCQGAQKKPGQLTDVGNALDEFLWPAEKKQMTFRMTLQMYPHVSQDKASG